MPDSGLSRVLQVALCGGLWLAGGAAAQTKPGEQVYREVCMACHAAGVANAPKFGDRKAWAPLIAEGQAVLTAHGWVGVRGMPARGGNPNLSLEEFSRATAYMARTAGGTWKDPDPKMLAAIRAEEKRRIDSLKAKK
ncbi:MAG: cytochrome c5 family protein [Burkholderiales bacterium]|nr:cytochrome c5 family protein [Burkholderiales bacterium]